MRRLVYMMAAAIMLLVAAVPAGTKAAEYGWKDIGGPNQSTYVIVEPWGKYGWVTAWQKNKYQVEVCADWAANDWAIAYGWDWVALGAYDCVLVNTNNWRGLSATRISSSRIDVWLR